MILKLKRTPGVFLVGFMGSGKTTVGRLLAGALGWDFTDLDDDIEAAAGRAISDIFASEGEEVFRRLESETLTCCVRSIQAGHAAVVALGGGAFTPAGNVACIRENGVSIWLDCPLELARERVERESHRPLARDPERFEALYGQRRAAYAQADFRVETARLEPAAIVESILRLPAFL